MTKKKKKNRRWIIWLAIIALALIGILVYMKSQAKPKGVAIKVDKVTKRTIKEAVSASGKIFPEKEIKISSDVSGEIVKLLVKEGDSVVVGQVLAKIDPEFYASGVERGEAGLNSARSQIAISESQIQNSLAQKEQIQAQLQNAQTVHKRNKQLFDDGVISQVELEQSSAALKGLEANLKSANASIESARKTKESTSFTVKSSEAALKELRTSLNRTTIKAPASGIISSLSVEQGERVVGTVQMTGTEMMRIANLTAMEVQVDVSENDILKVEVGDVVEIEVDAYLEERFSGSVTEIANSASNISSMASLNSDQVTNFVVKVRIDPNSYDAIGAKYPFRPGMSSSVSIFTETKEDVLTIPIQAVTTREQEDENGDPTDEFDEVVFVHSGDTVKMVKIQTGIQDDEFIIVEKGLELDTDIVSGPYSAISKKLDEGDQVRIKEEKEEKDEKDD